MRFSVGESAHQSDQYKCGCGFLSQNASPGDLIVVQNAWEGITFNRYYRGRVRSLNVPPIDSHELHRSDLVMAAMNQPQAMTGNIPIARSKDAPPGPTPLPPPSEPPDGGEGRIYICGTNSL